MFDALCSEYGWTTDDILDGVTPAQARVLLDEIARRRRTESARWLDLVRMAVWGNGRSFEQARRALADDDARDDLQKLAAMGIGVRRSRNGSGRDDGEPAR